MSAITVFDLAKSYGPVNIFAGLNFALPNNGKVAIVGPNGIGKTTLLRIIAGLESPSQGKVQISKSATIGYLPQESKLDSGNTLWDECLLAFERLINLEQELAQLTATLEGSAAPEDLDRYGRLQTAFEHAGGYAYEQQIRLILTGLGFRESDYRMPLSKLSGGQRTRALLAKLLLQKPDVLILDEPTNHLDIAAVEWLESYLRDWEGAVLIVSHDRYFMDRVVQYIWEMSSVGFEVYRGAYTNYLMQRQIRWEDRRANAEAQIQRLEKDLEYIRKNISGQRTQQAKGKLSRLSREIVALEKLGFRGVQGKNWGAIADEAGGIDNRGMKVEEAARRLAALKLDEPKPLSVGLQMRSKDRSGNVILRGEGLGVGYAGAELFFVEELELQRLECAALIGPNGSGKTTFLKTILGELEPLKGKLKLGASLNIGYFAQAHEDLDPNATIIEEIDRLGAGMLEKEIRNFLGRYLFHGDDQYKKVSVLSGGERGRLALAKLALQDANFLVLDEPNNHLDIPAQEILQNVLGEFDGTILLVSHDRYLIDALATQIWEIDTVNGALKIYHGSYSEYRSQAVQVKGEIEIEGTKKLASLPEQNESKPTLSKNQRQEIQKKIDSLEDKIINLESKLDKISKALQAPFEQSEDIVALGEDYAYTQSILEAAIEDWERLIGKMSE